MNRTLPLAIIIGLFSEQIKTYIISPLSSIFISKIIINTQDDYKLTELIYNYIRLKSNNYNKEIINNDQYPIGIIYCYDPFIIFEITSVLGDNLLMNNNDINNIKTITIYSFTYTSDDFIKLLKNSYDTYKDYIHIYTQHNSGTSLKWIQLHREQIHKPNLTYYPSKLIKTIDTLVKRHNKKRINKKSQSQNNKNKLCLLFHGNPGTGKTSFIKNLAMMHKKDIFIVDTEVYFNLSINPSQRTFRSNISFRQCENNIIVFEDIDRFFHSIDQDSFNLSEILNFLDGLSTTKNTIYILTANDISVIPEVVKRPGRIDNIIEFPMLSEQIISNISRDYDMYLNDEIRKSFVNKSLAELLSYLNNSTLECDMS